MSVINKINVGWDDELKCSSFEISKIISNFWSKSSMPPLLLLLLLLILYKRRSIPCSNVKQFQIFKIKLEKQRITQFSNSISSCFVHSFFICVRVCVYVVCVCDKVAVNFNVIFVICHRIAPKCNSNWSIIRMIRHFSYDVLTAFFELKVPKSRTKKH